MEALSLPVKTERSGARAMFLDPAKAGQALARMYTASDELANRLLESVMQQRKDTLRRRALDLLSAVDELFQVRNRQCLESLFENFVPIAIAECSQGRPQ